MVTMTPNIEQRDAPPTPTPDAHDFATVGRADAPWSSSAIAEVVAINATPGVPACAPDGQSWGL